MNKTANSNYAPHYSKSSYSYSSKSNITLGEKVQEQERQIKELTDRIQELEVLVSALYIQPSPE